MQWLVEQCSQQLESLLASQNSSSHVFELLLLRFVVEAAWHTFFELVAGMQDCTLEEVLSGTHRMQMLLHQRVEIASNCCQAMVYMQAKV